MTKGGKKLIMTLLGYWRVAVLNLACYWEGEDWQVIEIIGSLELNVPPYKF